MRAGDELQAIDVIELQRIYRELIAFGVREGKVGNVERAYDTSVATLSPKSQPAPRGDIDQVSTSSGSLHTKSQKAPSWGISCALATTRTWSRVRISGLRPPCTHRTLPSMMAARARKSKTWQHDFQTEALPYFCWHSS